MGSRGEKTVLKSHHIRNGFMLLFIQDK